MENLLEMAGVVMARLYMIYGMVFLILPLLSFAYVIVLAGVIWTVAAHFRGREGSPGVPRWPRSPGSSPRAARYPRSRSNSSSGTAASIGLMSSGPRMQPHL